MRKKDKYIQNITDISMWAIENKINIYFITENEYKCNVWISSESKIIPVTSHTSLKKFIRKYKIYDTFLDYPWWLFIVGFLIIVLVNIPYVT